MKNIKMFGLVAAVLLKLSFAQGQTDAKSKIMGAVQPWAQLAGDFSLDVATEDGTTITGSGTISGYKITVEAELAGVSLKKLSLILPPSTNINTGMIDKLAGAGSSALIPKELNAALTMERVEVEFAGKTITSAGIILSGSSWIPFQGQDLSIGAIKTKIAILDPTKPKKNILIDIKGELNLPGELSKYLGIGETKLSVIGSVNSKTKKLSIAADLSSESIPLGNQDILVFKNAFIEFYLEAGKPGLCIGGKLELRPPNESPKLLNGEVSIDLTGQIFAEAWMDGTWRNPFGISDQVYIYDPGIGIGVDISKPPFPLPILGIQGGLSVGNADPEKARFGGKVTLALNAGDPTQNMLDAQNINANLYDIISTFYPKGMPSHLSSLLKKTQISNARLTIVPPGNGVEIFGNHYEPGINASGVFQLGGHTGALLLSINENEIQAYGGLSAIKYTGFELTGSNGTGGPEAYLLVPANNPSGGLFGLDGKLKVLGIETSANVYMSDQGFNLTVNGKILDAFESTIDIAGTDIMDGGSIYIHANMKTDLFNKINEIAADEIGKVAKETNAKFDEAKQGLEVNRPKLNASKASYEAQKKLVMEKNQRECDKLNDAEARKAAKQKELDDINAKIASVDAQISSLKSKIAGAHQKATFNKSTTCTGSSFYDPQNGGECWTCPSGTNRTAYPVSSSSACSKPAYEIYKTGKQVGTWTILSPCPAGTLGDPNGKCYEKPAGYNRSAYPITHARAWSKLVPEQLSSATKVKSCACTGSSFWDPRNGGECWTCPSGTKRTAYAVTDSRACVANNFEQWNLDLAAKETEKAALIVDKEVRVKAIGDILGGITQAMEDGCKVVGNSELVNVDPTVAPKLAEFQSYELTVNGFQTMLDGLNGLSQGTLKAAEYVVRNGGSAVGILNVTKADFTSCLSIAAGGYVSMNVVGTYADQPLNCSFDIQIDSPEATIRKFADALMATNTSKGLKNNGTCTRPNVPKPNLSGTQIQDLKNRAKQVGAPEGSRPEIQKRPAWAGEERFKEGTFEEQLKAALAKSSTADVVRCAGYRIDMNYKTITGETPLLNVAKEGNLSDVVYLVDHGADPILAGTVLMDGKYKIATLAGIAAYRGELDLLQYAIEACGNSVDGKGEEVNGLSPLSWAILNGKSDCAKYLLDKGAKPTGSSKAVVLAANNKNTTMVNTLLDKGYSPKQSDFEGNQALHHAVVMKDVALVNKLIGLGVDVNAKNNKGLTPLILAAQTGQMDVCQALVKAKANLEIEYDRWDAEKWAKKNGFKDLSKYLKNPY